MKILKKDNVIVSEENGGTAADRTVSGEGAFELMSAGGEGPS